MAMLKWIPDPHPPLLNNSQQLSEIFFESHYGLVAKPAHVVLLDQDPLLRISDNDKLESLACNEDTKRVECGFKMSGIISI